MRSLIDRVHDRIGVCAWGLDIAAILGGIGAAVTAGAAPAGSGAAIGIGAGTVAAGAAGLAGTGVSISQALKKPSTPPTITAAERAAEAARRRGILAKTGRQSTITPGLGSAGASSLGKSVLSTGSSPL